MLVVKRLLSLEIFYTTAGTGGSDYYEVCINHGTLKLWFICFLLSCFINFERHWGDKCEWHFVVVLLLAFSLLLLLMGATGPASSLPMDLIQSQPPVFPAENTLVWGQFHKKKMRKFTSKDCLDFVSSLSMDLIQSQPPFFPAERTRLSGQFHQKLFWANYKNYLMFLCCR